MQSSWVFLICIGFILIKRGNGKTHPESTYRLRSYKPGWWRFKAACLSNPWPTQAPCFSTASLLSKIGPLIRFDLPQSTQDGLRERQCPANTSKLVAKDGTGDLDLVIKKSLYRSIPLA